MSGKSAVSGFVYQMIATVLESLSDTRWAYLTVEPDESNEKADILLENSSGALTYQQVKSSMHNFSRTQITRWLIEMMTAEPGAQLYELILIGNRENNVSEFIEKLNKQTLPDLSSTLIPFADKVSVKSMLLDSDILQGHIQNEMHCFLSERGHHPTHAALGMVTGGLLFQFFEFAMVGRRLSREKWAEDVLTWVTRSFPRSLHLDHRIDGLSVGIYIPTTHGVFRSSTGLRHDLAVGDWVSRYCAQARKQFRVAAGLTFPTEPDALRSHLYSQTVSRFPLGFSGQPKVIIGPSEQNYLSDKVRDYLQEKVPEGFFHLGNLRKGMTRAPFESSVGVEGTESEKKKYTALRGLQSTFIFMDELSALLNSLNELYYLPLILSNEGSKHDEEIMVTITLPASVRVITAADFYQPCDLNFLKACLADDTILNLLHLQGDSSVDPFPYRPLQRFEVPRDPLYNMLYPISHDDQLKEKQDKWTEKLKDLLEWELFDEVSGYWKIRYRFPQINPNRKIAMPTYLFFQTNTSFNIEYEIVSKNTPARQKGTLYCDISRLD